MSIALLAKLRRNFTVGLLQNIADVLETFSVVVLNSIQILRMDEFDQKIRHIINGIFVTELEFSHTAFSQFMKNQADRVVFWNRVPQDINHWNTPLSYRRLVV